MDGNIVRAALMGAVVMLALTLTVETLRGEAGAPSTVTVPTTTSTTTTPTTYSATTIVDPDDGGTDSEARGG